MLSSQKNSLSAENIREYYQKGFFEGYLYTIEKQFW